MKFVDAHCDTLTKVFYQGENLFENTGHIRIPLLSVFENPVQFFAVFLGNRHLDNPFQDTLKIIDFFHEQVAQYSTYIATATKMSEVEENQANGLISGFLSLEGGEALEGNIQNLEVFYALGVRSITIAWNRRSALADGVGVPSGQGLTTFGKEVVLKMQELGMIVDVSHVTPYGFWDIYELMDQPIMASHSNADAVYHHPRNLTDDQILAIAQKGGVIGINLYSNFVANEGEADINQLMRHIDHILTIGGEDCVGFGCDLDGCTTLVDGISDVSDMVKVYYYLEKQYGTVIANKIFSGNFIELFKKIL